MSYTFLLEQGEESSAASFSDIPACVQSRLNLTVARCSSSGNGTESFQSFRSGMTCAPSTAGHGAGVLKSSVGDSLARTLVPSTPRPSGLAANGAVYGGQWRESSVKFDLDTSSWKTHRCLWDEDLPLSSVTLPEWGSMQSGECWERGTPALRSNETGSGSWVRSPMAKDGRGFYRASLQAARNRRAGGRTIHWIHQALLSSGWSIGTANPRFSEVLMAWPILWSSLEPLATDRFQAWLLSHGEHFPLHDAREGILALEYDSPRQLTKNMNKPPDLNELLRVRVAELCGTLACPGCGWKQLVCWPHDHEVPNYPEDLNACTEFEKGLSPGQKQRYCRHILVAIPEAGGITEYEYEVCTFATAEQRCRAFIATMEAAKDLDLKEDLGEPGGAI